MTPGQHADHAEDILTSLPAERGQRDHMVAAAQVHALLALYGQFAQFTRGLALVLGGDHPPVPEQAITRDQAEWIAENTPLWAGWQPGTWPVHDPVDPRGFRWDDPLRDERN